MPSVPVRPPQLVDVSRKLKTDVFEVVTASQRLLTQTTNPVAFYCALSDMIIAQRRAVQALPGGGQIAEDLNRMLDSVEAATESVRLKNEW